MKLTVTQNDLAKALGNVSRIAIAQSGNSMLGNVLFRTNANKLIVTATNLEVVMVDTIAAQVEAEGAIAVPAKVLTEFICNLPNTEVEIEVKNNLIYIKAGTYQSTINAVDPEDYPAIPESNEANSLELSAEVLKEIVTRVSNVASTDASRPLLNGVCFDTDDDGLLHLVATDGYRLAELKLMKLDHEVKMIVPYRALQDATRIAADSDMVLIKYSDDQVSFVAANARVTSRLIDGKYINYASLIPNDTKFTVTLNRAEWVKAAKIAEPFSRPNNTIIIKVEGNVMKVRSVAGQMGINSSELAVKAEGGDVAFNVNCRYLIEALNCLHGDDVTIHTDGGMAPIVLTGDQDDYLHLVMPMRN